jgi:mono/diheme cytochrome c family protein
MCHGVRGDGAGFLAAGFDVKPRDFRSGVYEFRSTTSDLPTFADIERTVRVGVPGTSMPAWGQFLSAEEIGDVSRYLAVFSPQFVKALRKGAAPEVLAMSAPPADLAPLAERGAELWKTLECAQCHGSAGRGDGKAGQDLKDSWGQPIRAADLTFEWSFRNGHAPEDVYRTVFGGLNGTPMPAYGGAVEPAADRWAVVAYVLSLSPSSRPALHLEGFAAQRAERIGPDGHVVAGPRGADRREP